MKGTVFSTSSTPYFLSLLTTAFDAIFHPDNEGAMGKISDDIELSYGREGVVNKNGVEFLFNIGDVIVGDSVVKFFYQPDTLVYSSTEELNQVVKTNAFYLSPSTEFYFTDFYFVVNDSIADTALTETDLVNFKAQLVNEQTGQVVGTFDDVTYTKENLEKYENVSYLVDCSSINAGDYYLRLVTTVQGDAEYNLGNVQNDGASLGKKNYSQISFDGKTMPQTYELSQNFPNPFNPSTTIKYQIPKTGNVTLKIYDILGSEIATLVNEVKSEGRYEVNFDASKLASGVYIYRLQVNGTSSSLTDDFVSTKKMILMK